MMNVTKRLGLPFVNIMEFTDITELRRVILN
jgi:hypothetical protein